MRKVLGLNGGFKASNMKDLAFRGIKGIKIYISHLFPFFKAAICELRTRHVAVLSAKSLKLDLTCSGRSMMNIRKRIGLGPEPCGTPEETSMQFEFTPFMTTVCFPLSRKSLIHFRVSPLIP